MLFAMGCAGQWHRPAVVAYIEIEQNGYANVVDALNQAVAKYEFLVSKADGLDDAVGRATLFLAYRSADGNATALDVSDVKRQGRVDFRLYRDFFRSDADFKEFVNLIVGAMAEFGAVRIEVGSEYIAR